MTYVFESLMLLKFYFEYIFLEINHQIPSDLAQLKNA